MHSSDQVFQDLVAGEIELGGGKQALDLASPPGRTGGHRCERDL